MAPFEKNAGQICILHVYAYAQARFQALPVQLVGEGRRDTCSSFIMVSWSSAKVAVCLLCTSYQKK
jgi:hypothetical protein